MDTQDKVGISEKKKPIGGRPNPHGKDLVMGATLLLTHGETGYQERTIMVKKVFCEKEGKTCRNDHSK